MRMFSLKTRLLLPYIISISVGLNLLFFTLLIDSRKWQSPDTTKSSIQREMIWPSKEISYRILTNFACGKVRYNYTDSVTYTTHGTPEYLYNLEELSKRWNGPISVAVYTPGSDLLTANDVINKLVYCGGETVRNFVSFHLFFEENDDFYQSSQFINTRDNNNPNCSEWENEKSKNQKPETFRHQKNLTYPVNVGRNIARILANTYYVLTSDLELFPSEDFIEKFMSMVGREIKTHSPPRVYVLPVFEVENGVDPPRNKSELVKLFSKNKAITFHKHLCSSCHQIPDEVKWLNTSGKTKKMNVFKVVKRNGRWEPIFVGTNRDPLYDERLNWEGMNDKMTQMYEMCLMNYELHILDDAFLVHASGIKRDREKNLNWRKPFIKNHSLLKKQIMSELLVKHPGKSKCEF